MRQRPPRLATTPTCQLIDRARLTLLKGLDVSRGEGDSDLVDLGGTGTGLVELVLLVVGHVCDFVVCFDACASAT